jgi:hypothetical protein
LLSLQYYRLSPYYADGLGWRGRPRTPAGASFQAPAPPAGYEEEEEVVGDISLLDHDSLYGQELKQPLYNSEDCQGWSEGWLAAADAKIPLGDDNSSWLTGEEGIVAGSSSNAALGDSAMVSGMEARTLISEMPRDREEGGVKTTGEEMEREVVGGNLPSSVRPFLNRPPRYPA